MTQLIIARCVCSSSGSNTSSAMKAARTYTDGTDHFCHKTIFFERESKHTFPLKIWHTRYSSRLNILNQFMLESWTLQLFMTELMKLRVCSRCPCFVLKEKLVFNSRPGPCGFGLNYLLNVQYHTTPHHTNCCPELQDLCSINYFYLRYFEGSEHSSFILCLLVKIVKNKKTQLITTKP